jgi:hypothetical protein
LENFWALDIQAKISGAVVSLVPEYDNKVENTGLVFPFVVCFDV